MPDVTFSPLNNSELESGVVTVTFNQSKDSVNGAANEDVTPSADIPGKSSVLTASFNFINSIVGAGIIGIPYAIQRCGFVAGVIMLAYVAYLVYQSVTMLIDCGVKAKKLDFEELAEHLLGRSGYYAALVFMFLFAYGAQVAYLVVIGDTIPVVAKLFLPDSIFANRNITIALMSTIIVLPLCLLKDLSSLSWTSMLSIAADIALVLIVLIAAPSASVSEGIKHTEVSIINSSIFVGIGTMSFAFVCQHNSFIVFRTLKEKTSKNWDKVAKGSIFFSFLMCATLGIAGYLCFLEETKGDILNNFPEKGVAVSVARLLLAFCMVFTYPMECFVTRHCLLSIVHRVMSDREKELINAKAKLILSGLGSGLGSRGVDPFGDIEEENPMMRRAQALRKNNISTSDQRYAKQDGTDPRSRHKDGGDYDSGEERPGGARRDSLEILLSASEDSRGDKNEKDRERERESGGAAVVYFNAESDSESKERRSDEDVVRNDGGKGKDRQRGKEKVKEKKRSSSTMRSGESKSESRSAQSGSNNNSISKHSSTTKVNSRNGSRSNSPQTLFTMCDTNENQNDENDDSDDSDSEKEDVTSNDSVSSPCSVSTVRTACSAVNEKSEIEEETKSFSLIDGRKKHTSSFDENRMKIENLKNVNLKNDKSREGSRSVSPVQNGEIVCQDGESYKDTVFININDQITEKKSEMKKHTNINSSDDFDYDVFHSVSLRNTQDDVEKESNNLFFSRICPCCSSCPCGLMYNPFSDHQNTSRVAVTLLLWGSSVAIALMFRDLGMVLAFTGAVAASMLGYVLPGVLYLQSYKTELKSAWFDAIGLETEDSDMSDANSVQVMNNIIHKNNENNDNNDNNDNNNSNNNNTLLNNNNVNSSDISNSLSSESSMSENTDISCETRNLVTGRKRKTKYQKFRALSRFFMPCFMILFGCVSMVIGVTSVFLF